MLETYHITQNRLAVTLVQQQIEHLGSKITIESIPEQLCFTVELFLIEQIA